MENIFFKTAIIEDIPMITDMMQQFYLIDNYLFDREATAENIRNFINKPEYGNIWLIRKEETIIGYLIMTIIFSFEFKGKNAFIDELYIIKQYRNLGAGGKAVKYAITQAEKQGIKALHLEVEKHNLKAIKVYEKQGFKQHNRFMMTRFI